MLIPYKSKPQVETVDVGDEKSGTISLEKLYDLTPLESEYIEEQNKKHGIKSMFEAATDVANTIVEKQTDTYDRGAVETLVQRLSGLPEDDDTALAEIKALRTQAKAIASLQRPLELADVVSKLLANDTTIIMNNLADVTEWQEKQEKQAPISDRILATAMLRFRVFTDANQDWTLESTEKALKNKDLKYKMLKALATFAENERNHWEKNPNELDQEELKKRLNDLKAKEKKSTGTKSSGG